jgi:hypothetical protein
MRKTEAAFPTTPSIGYRNETLGTFPSTCHTEKVADRIDDPPRNAIDL